MRNMRTKKEAEEIYKKYTPLITGKPLPESFAMSLSDSSKGMPKAGIIKEEDETFNIIFFSIAPKKYWESISEAGIISLIAQEFVHGDLFHYIPSILVNLEEKIFKIKKEFPYKTKEQIYQRKIALREEYEIGMGLITPMLNLKLHIDEKAIKHLADKNLPNTGYPEILDYLLEDEMLNTEPLSRSIVRQWLVRMRAYQINLLLQNTSQSIKGATTLRNYIQYRSNQVLANLEVKTPSTV